ncbi:MAG TPA: tripartite tricarboxylate transporter substrate binding protein [Xanthobacteraceae bacterium]|jgi:tripartite-type tricarboxylate transporter receptor subunit TctC
MALPRRTLLQIVAAAAAAPALLRTALALDYPTRPVHIVVTIPPGLAPDVVARLIAAPLSSRLGQSIVIDSRPGAGGNIGTESVVRAPADGYTLLLVISGNAANNALYPNLSFNFVHDIAPVAFLGFTPFVVLVNPSLPVKSIPELIAYAKANPRKINWGSPGAGTAPHLSGELFKMMTGVDIVHVPYRGSYIPDLLGGQVQISFTAAAGIAGYVGSGQLRALAVTSAKRLEALPDLPAINESVPGYEGSGWLGIGAPKDTPAEIIERLNAEINAIVANPDMKARFVGQGVEPELMTPAQFGKLIAQAADKWAKVIRFANIRGE